MFISKLLTVGALASAAFGARLPRQSTNTNERIYQIVSVLSQSTHVNIPNIVTLQARGNATDASLHPEFEGLVTSFSTAADDLNGTDVTSGSNTTFPTNDDISFTFANVIIFVSTGLSGLTTDMAANLNNMFGDLDPAMASSITALNRTLPGSADIAHIMMLDASQFLEAEGMAQTLVSLGF